MGANARVIAVASGKGGTGKTLVATGLAALLVGAGVKVVLADCDVEAPNDHLFFELERLSEREVHAASVRVDAATCTACGICRDACAFGAIRVLGPTAMVFDELCHGCGMCERLCPAEAITEIQRCVGAIEVSQVVGRHDGLRVVTGRLDVGEVKTPDVIRATRAEAERLDADVVILDAPPGVACASVAAIRGADVVVHVTEPTRFGLHDLELSVRLAENLGATSVAVINRLGTGPVDVETWCAQHGMPVLANIPFDRSIAETYARGTVASDESALVARELAGLARTLELLGEDDPVTSQREEDDR